MEYLLWIKGNYVNILLALSALIGAAEMIVRFTPTKADDGAVQRIGGYLKAVMDFLKIPNIKQ